MTGARSAPIVAGETGCKAPGMENPIKRRSSRYLDQSAGITGAKNVPDHKIQVMKKVQMAFAVCDSQ